VTLTLWNTPTSWTNVYYDADTQKIVVYDKRTNSQGAQFNVYYVLAILCVIVLAYWYQKW
jgi:hypothetical protein